MTASGDSADQRDPVVIRLRDERVAKRRASSTPCVPGCRAAANGESRNCDRRCEAVEHAEYRIRFNVTEACATRQPFARTGRAGARCLRRVRTSSRGRFGPRRESTSSALETLASPLDQGHRSMSMMGEIEEAIGGPNGDRDAGDRLSGDLHHRPHHSPACGRGLDDREQGLRVAMATPRDHDYPPRVAPAPHCSATSRAALVVR